jgi:ATP-dependent Clp protease ATP-binding subunit ClpA
MSPVLQLIWVSLAVILLLFAYMWIWRSTRHRQPRFTVEAQRAISFARVEAERLQSPTITRLLPLEEHTAIRQEIQEHVSGGAIVDYRDDLPFGDEARQVLVGAAREARSLSSRQIGAEHLLLGLLHSETSLAALILRQRGLRLEPLRAKLGGWQP